MTAPLCEIAARAAEAGIRRARDHAWSDPSAGLRDTLAWLERRPLHGQVVAVTRARAQASGLARTAAPSSGAEVVEAPAIRIEPRPVDCEVAEAMSRHPRVRPRLLHEPERRAAAVRRARDRRAATRARSRARPWPRSARARPRSSSGAGSAPTWCRRARWPRRWWRRSWTCRWRAARVLVARAAEARDVLPDALRERGARVCDVGALRHRRRAARRRAARARSRRATYVTFTSSSTVRFFLGVGRRRAATARAWCRSAR